MAIAILVSSPAESERFAAFGLDLATRLSSDVVFLCVAPPPPVEKAKPDKGNKKDPVKPEKHKQPEPPGASSSSHFVVAKSFVKTTRDHVLKHIGSLRFGFVNNDVVEVPNQVAEIRSWITCNHESPHLGHYSIDTIFIPMLRGAGLEHAREPKERLFEDSQIETVYVNVNHGSGRLPLNNVGVAAATQTDLLNATRLAQRLANCRVTRMNEQERAPEQKCVIAAVPGKAKQTRIDNCSVWKALRKDSTLPVAMLLNPADTRVERVNSFIDDKICYWFRDYQLEREDRIRLSQKLESGAASSPEFILFMAVATFLACIGLIQDSPAVIIGAMLVAPLMTPLLSAGMAMIFGNKPLFGRAIKAILIGVALAFGIGVVVGLFSLVVPAYLMSGNGLALTSEMISRSQPNLLDPFIGLAAGLAGGFAIGRDGQIGTVAGVAIAAALVPPIGTAGLEAALAIYCSFQTGDPATFIQLLQRDPGKLLSEHSLYDGTLAATAQVHMVSAPLILFALNACATIIGAFLGLRLVGMHRTLRPRQSRAWVVMFMMVLLAAILLLIFAPLMF